ncbi:MAG: GTPase HflX [Desulfobacterales bacterium]|nr:GTPase HflX [Desulfobacterales bacterium]
MKEQHINNAPIQNKKIVLLALHTSKESHESIKESLTELAMLAQNLGYDVADTIIQTREHAHPVFFFGKGKLESIKSICKEHNIDIILIDARLSPKQGKFIESKLECRVLDRTQIILTIFADHAQTREAKYQIELAQSQYMLPRLTGLWQHLDRERGGISASRGTGEKQLNIDRKMLTERIHRLKQELIKIEKIRKNQTKKRTNSLKVTLVGYTNSGKSTLMNALTQADVLVENKLFATLDSTTRLIPQNTWPDIVISDTVGFIRNIPHELVASFRSTLSIVKEADLLLEIVDANAPIESHIQTTQEVLEDIQAATIPRLLVLNKMDTIDEERTQFIYQRYPNATYLSAISGNIQHLFGRIKEFFENKMETFHIHLQYHETHKLVHIYQLSRVNHVNYQSDNIILEITTFPEYMNRLRSLLKPK